MAETTAREAKLIQYLNEAYGKEKQLVTMLQAQIKLASLRAPLKKRLQEHLKETREQAKGLERRIKQLGGKAETNSIPGPDLAGDAVGAVASAANKALAAAKAPVQALRGTSPADNLLRNVRDAFWNEAEEIAHYDVIEATANELGDADTAKLAKTFRRQEERMQAFLSKEIPRLVKEVIKAEVPRAERQPAAASSSRSSSRASRSTSRSSGTSRTRASGSSSRGPSSRRAASSARSSGGSRSS